MKEIPLKEIPRARAGTDPTDLYTRTRAMAFLRTLLEDAAHASVHGTNQFQSTIQPYN